MIITLQNFNDLGKCSMGTLLDRFDTEKDRIMLNDTIVEVKSINDLFPYLWCVAGCTIGTTKEGNTWFFNSKKTWWQNHYDESIEFHTKLIKKFDKKLEKKYTQDVEDDKNDSLESIEHAKRCIEELNKRMVENQKEIINENSLL